MTLGILNANLRVYRIQKTLLLGTALLTTWWNVPSQSLVRKYMCTVGHQLGASPIVNEHLISLDVKYIRQIRFEPKASSKHHRRLPSILHKP